MFATAPVLVLKRTVIIRVVLCLFLAPVILGFAWGAYAALEEPADTTGAAISAVLCLITAALFWFFFARESNRRTTLYEDGIAQTRGSKTTELRWNEVTEIWFRAVKVQVGGLIGAAVGAAVEAYGANKGKPLDDRAASITIRILGHRGTKVVINSNDKGVMKAFEMLSSRVNPRLVEAVVRRVRQGETVSFGKMSLSLRGVAYGRKDPMAFQDIGKLSIEKGRLVLKKKGAWLAAQAVPVQNIPNLFVLTEAYAQVADGAVDRSALQAGRNLASRSMMV